MSDFGVRLEEARARLPLRRLMEQRGRGPANGNWRRFPECPYCRKDSAGLFEGGHGEMFKCYHAHCPSGTAAKGCAWDEVKFLRHELDMPHKEAAITLMKEAGLWQDKEAYAPSVMPGKAARKTPPPSENDGLVDTTTHEDQCSPLPGSGQANLTPSVSVAPEEIAGAVPVTNEPGPESWLSWYLASGLCSGRNAFWFS